MECSTPEETVNIAAEQKKHPIFTHDPGELVHYVYKEVCVTSEEGSTHVGWVYTVDPVSQCVVLVNFDSNGSMTGLKVIMGHSVQNIVIVDDDSQKHKTELDSLFKPKQNSFSPEEISLRKDNLVSWLLRNRIPIEISKENSDMLVLSDALTIEPPYKPENCRSTNEIILDRVQALMKNMPEET